MGLIYPKIQNFINGLEFAEIPDERKEALQGLSSFLHKKQQRKKDSVLSFICTHNSRRSQLCQIWAHTAAFYYGLGHLKVTSGGTEATAFHPNAVRAMEQTGFEFVETSGGGNPHYKVHFSRDAEPIETFSKLYQNAQSDSQQFIAVLTCSDAEANCPFIPDAEARFAIKYQDPKMADGTAEESQVYAVCSKKIATELFYLFSLVHKWQKENT